MVGFMGKQSKDRWPSPPHLIHHYHNLASISSLWNMNVPNSRYQITTLNPQVFPPCTWSLTFWYSLLWNYQTQNRATCNLLYTLRFSFVFKSNVMTSHIRNLIFIPHCTPAQSWEQNILKEVFQHFEFPCTLILLRYNLGMAERALWSCKPKFYW